MKPQCIGWDTHRKFSKVTLAEKLEDGQMRVVERATLEHEDRSALQRWLKRIEPGTPVALEAAFGWPWIADLLEECGLEPHLAHPPAMKELAKHEAKGDRCDADRLAKFQLRGILPESYLAPAEVRQIRERTRYRMALSKIRGGLKNRIQAILHRHGIVQPYSDLFGQAGRAFLKGLPLPEASRSDLDGYVELLDAVLEKLAEVERWMEDNLPRDAAVRRLATIPGIALILAHVIRAEVGEINRFPSRRHLASYAGLAPLSDDSADRHGARHCSQACNHVLRWALIEAASGALRPNNKKGGQPLRQLYARLTRDGRDRKNQAKVAVARELSELVYIVWTKEEPYRQTPPQRPGSNPKATPAKAEPQPAKKQARGSGRRPAASSKGPRPAVEGNNHQTKVAEQGARAGVPCGSANGKTQHSDQPRHPMVRQKRAGARGQTRS